MQAVKQANAQSEAKKAQASGAQSANASYGTEFATETDVHAVKNKMHNQLQNNHNLLVQISNERKHFSNSGEVFSLCFGHGNENKTNDITSNKSTNVVKGEGS